MAKIKFSNSYLHHHPHFNSFKLYYLPVAFDGHLNTFYYLDDDETTLNEI